MPRRRDIASEKGIQPQSDGYPELQDSVGTVESQEESAQELERGDEVASSS